MRLPPLILSHARRAPAASRAQGGLMERRDRVDLFVDGTHFEIPLSELSYAISLCKR